MDICVFGAGSLGSLIGGLLAREHEVVLVGREPHVDRVNAAGLTITGVFEERVVPEAKTAPPARADLAVVTVKAFDTDAAARELSACELGGALSLQNGMGNEAKLAANLGCPVLAGTCTYGARLESPGVVACTGTGEVVLGPREGGSSVLADRVGEAFRSAGIETDSAKDMPDRLWEKLAVNAAINATTALARVPNGALVDGPGCDVARQAARETARAARSAGTDLARSAAVETALEVATTTAENTSSMHQDVQDRKRTEIDAINGYVVQQADRPVPVNRTLTELVRAWEHERGLRPDG